MIDSTRPLTGRDERGHFIYCITCGNKLKDFTKAIGLCHDCVQAEHNEERKRQAAPKQRRKHYSFQKG